MPDILGIGSSGLSAYRRLLETTGSNIVNANTDGYKRRAVSLDATGASAMLPTSMSTVSGSGVMVDKVSRASDQFLEQQYYRANSGFQKAQTLSTGLQRIESAIFTIEDNLSTAAQSFFDRASDLANDPTSKPARFAFIDSGERLVDEFRRIYSNVKAELDAADQALSTSVRLTNALTSQVEAINLELDRRYTNGQPANDILDQRDRLLADLSELVDFTTVEAETGAVTLYLGEAATGAPLVDRQRGRELGLDVVGDNVTLILDPYSAPTPTSRLGGGVLQGIIELRQHLTGLRDVVDRLALGIASAANQRHVQGVDENGRPGKPLFATESLEPVPSPTNGGVATLSIEVDKDAVLNGSSYSAVYNAETQLWTVRSELTQSSVTGATQATLDGLTFKFRGAPKNGDSFVAEPLRNAAGSIRFLRDDVTEIATGLAIYVDGAPQNSANSELSILDTGQATEKPSPASLGKLLANATSDQLSFRRDGIAYSLLSGSTDTRIVSLGELSALSFTFDPSEVKLIDQDGSPLQLSFTLDQVTTTEHLYSFDLETIGTDLQSIADEINRIADDEDLERKIFASVASGTLTINALGDHTISKGLLKGTDYDNVIVEYEPVEQSRIKAGEIVLFTTEGRQLTGSPYTARQAATLLTPENGFTRYATYQTPSETAGYRDLGVTSLASPLLLSEDANGQSVVKVNAFPEYDSPLATGDVLRPAGTVFALNVDGMSSIRLAGDAISGKDDVAIAEVIEEKLHAQAYERVWLGGLVNVSKLPAVSRLTMDLNGVEHDVIFTRARDADGKLLATGTFEAAGLPGLKIGLKQDGVLHRVEISGYRRMTQDAPTIEFSGEAAEQLGLLPGVVRTTLIAQRVSALPNTPVILRLATSAAMIDLSINGPNGTSDDGSIKWEFDADKRLLITSLDDGLTFATQAALQRDAAVSLGFLSTDRTITRDGAAVTIATTIEDERGTLADASDSVSRVAYSVNFASALPEDVIVAVKGDVDGQRILASRTVEPSVRSQPRAPDLKVRILSTADDGMLEIFDAASNTSIAHRSWRPGDVISYLDINFRLNTAVKAGDEFEVSRDQVRALDNRNALLLSGLRDAMLLERYGGSFQDAYSLAAAEFGATSEAAVLTTSINERSASELKTVLEGKTGINLDTEAADLIRYQQAYQAAAQVVSVARDMFDTILRTF